MPDAAKKTDTPEAEPDIATEDDLGRLRGILYGDHARQTSERMDTLEKALLGVIEDLRADMSHKIAALETRLTSEADTRTSALSNMGDRLTTEVKARDKALKSMTRDLQSTSNDLNSSIDHAAAQADSALAAARQDLTNRVDQTEHDLRTSGVDRATLANLFERFASEIKDQ